MKYTGTKQVFSSELSICETRGGRVNEGQCRALRKSATVQKLKPEDFNFYDNVGNFLLLDAGADGRGVARPYFVQGRYFMRKFKDRVRRGPLTRPSTTTSNGIFQFLAGVFFVFVISILIFCMVICIHIVVNIGGIQECQR